MKIIVGQYPPIIEQIDAAFGVRGMSVLFAWNGAIFNPAGIEVTPMLVEHERVHSYRQGGDPAGWWAKYIADQDFRLREETYAHGAELKWLNEHSSGRQARRKNLATTALRLTAPLYRYAPRLPVSKAKELLKAEIERTTRYQFGVTTM